MKTVTEVAVTLKNQPGTLSDISELLGANGINILALTVVTEGAEGVVSFLASDPSRVLNILHSAGYSPTTREIIAAEIPQHPGGLNTILKTLKMAGVNIEHIYTFIGGAGGSERTILLFGVDNTAAAHDALVKEWIPLYGEELYTY